MSKLKNDFQKEFEEKISSPKQFDVSKLDDNEPIASSSRKFKKRYVIIPSAILASLLILGVGVPLFFINNGAVSYDSSVKMKRKTLSDNEIKIASANTFERLNSFEYPLDHPNRGKFNFSEEEISSYSSFAYKTYKAIVNKKDASYSPATLYPALNELSFASSRSELDDKFDDLFSMDVSSRISFYQKFFANNYFKNERSTTKLHNGAFITNSHEINPSFIEKLTSAYAEAYSLDFLNQKAVDKMLSWINQAVESKDFIKKEDLGTIDSQTAFVLFSSMYFNCSWEKVYLDTDTYKDVFHGEKGDKTLSYMKHTYFASHYYDYDSYVSFQDYYDGGSSITYLVPKNLNSNIHDLIGDRNIFEEDETKTVKAAGYGRISITLSLPKFSQNNMIDLNEPIKNLGFSDIFDQNNDSFSGVFKDNAFPIYLAKALQKNEVSFSENGTIVKSVTVMKGGGSAAPDRSTNNLEVKLDQPFIYIIKDIQGFPLLVGSVDNL